MAGAEHVVIDDELAGIGEPHVVVMTGGGVMNEMEVEFIVFVGH